MHKYLMELTLNDENGNPLKGRDGFFYFDNEVALQEEYEKRRNTYQTTIDEDGNEVKTGIRKWKVTVSEAKYISVTDVDAIFSRIRG